VENNTLAQLTNTEGGQINFVLSPDGKYIYYLDEVKGYEIGHYVRLPLSGGEPG
jgi:Tol biopolymer transport system component